MAGVFSIWSVYDTAAEICHWLVGDGVVTGSASSRAAVWSWAEQATSSSLTCSTNTTRSAIKSRQSLKFCKKYFSFFCSKTIFSFILKFCKKKFFFVSLKNYFLPLSFISRMEIKLSHQRNKRYVFNEAVNWWMKQCVGWGVAFQDIIFNVVWLHYCRTCSVCVLTSCGTTS